jgi:hypothetical protein
MTLVPGSKLGLENELGREPGKAAFLGKQKYGRA